MLAPQTTGEPMRFPGYVLVVVSMLSAMFNSVADTPQILIIFGLTNVTLGQATFVTTNSIPLLTNLSSNGTDGVSILLGEADSGVFLFPDTLDHPEDGDYMVGKVYAKRSGVADRLICT